MTALLSVDGLTKSYGSTLALDDLSLTVASGAVFGLLGPNGSGKSTLIRLVLGFLHPDAGRIDFAGGERTIGYLPDRPAMPFGARLIEYLELMGKLAGLERSSLRRRARQQLADVGLIHAAEWRIGACSRGMLQRLALAAALIHDPALVILDEPLNGLDPAGQHAMRAQIQRIHAAGHTLLVSTHRLNDIAPLCTHLAILHRGQLVRSGAQAELLPLQESVTCRVQPMSASLVMRLQSQFPAADVSPVAIHLSGAACAHKSDVLRVLLDAGVDVIGLDQARTTPEDLYLEAIQGR
ncbi:MAG: ABC transporter ATP-binding protein [Caldilineaceae bacterium]|nr:ABC transporter ATP-binding protein [Caldilineaceae bacterium]